MCEVMHLIGKSLATEVVLRGMLHLMSALRGLNRGRIVLADFVHDIARAGLAACKPTRRAAQATGPSSAIRYAYGLTREEMARGRCGPAQGVTGRVLATAQPITVQDIDADAQFLMRAVERGLCTCQANGVTSPLSRSIARQFPTRCLSPSCLAMNPAPSRSHEQRVRAFMEQWP